MMTEPERLKKPPHTKRLGREFAMQFLYQRELSGEAEAHVEAESRFWEQLLAGGKFPAGRDGRRARKYAESLIGGVLAEHAALDALIRENTTASWSMSRMAAIDLSLLRIAVYEMLHCPDVPPIVSINEAIEISKEFSGEDSSSFINGVLNSILGGLDRPLRSPAPAAEG